MGPRELLAVDAATGQVRASFELETGYFPEALLPGPSPGTISLILKSDNHSKLRLVTIDGAALVPTEEAEIVLPRTGQLAIAEPVPGRRQIHLPLLSTTPWPATWLVLNKHHQILQEFSLSQPPLRWLFLPNMDLALTLTLPSVSSRGGSKLHALDASGTLRTIWEGKDISELGFGLVAGEGDSVVLAKAKLFLRGGSGTEILEVNPMTGESTQLITFGSWRDAGFVLTVPRACPEARLPVGDCNADGVVTINEVVFHVLIALSHFDLAHCPAIDQDGRDTVPVDELVAAVRFILKL